MADRKSENLGQGVFKLVFVLDLQNKNPKWPSPLGLQKLNSAMSFTLGVTNIRFCGILDLEK